MAQHQNVVGYQKPMNSPYLLNVKRSGSGPTLVLVHGVAGSNTIWEPVVAALSEHFEVIRVDLLGYGHSPKPRVEYTPQVHAASIRHTLKHLKLKPPYALAGLSMGTLLVLEYARLWPAEVSRLLCIGTTYYPAEADARSQLRHSISARIVLEQPLLGRLMIQGGWNVGKRNRRLAGAMAGAFGGFYTPTMAQESMRSTHQAFNSTLMNCLVYNRPGPLLDATSATPQWYLHGQSDRYSMLGQLQAALGSRPNCHLTVLEGVAHNTVVLAPDATAAWMIKSLGIPA